ncbi:Cardiolipin synthetase [Pleurostoma richardsiae]|uniref:Cardiolipin synthetase n=1 Tax=Pleurostoma richardsiae TaxID=41990 RepID=A0AA38VTC3_9PEZI|nr:Cardiolipin synthetase [Pleurostoma richardsiae]
MLPQTLPVGMLSSSFLRRPNLSRAMVTLSTIRQNSGVGLRNHCTAPVLTPFLLVSLCSVRRPGQARCLSGTREQLAQEQSRYGGALPAQLYPQRAPRLRKVLDSLPTARENIYTVPNMLTVSRLIAAPFVGYCILHDHHAWALGLFAYAGITDLLDGWMARRWNMKTVVGTVIDPMADKTLMTVLTITLAIKGGLPMWLAAVILGRDAGLGIAAIYYRWISLPPPKTFLRYWDFSLPSAEVRPTTISKYNTFLQLALMGLTTMAPVVPLEMGTTLTIMQYTVAATTVWSGASYVFSKDAVKILSRKESEGKQGDSRRNIGP